MSRSPHRTVAIDIGGTAIKIAVVWSDGRVARFGEIPTLAADGPEAALPRIVQAVHEAMRAESLETSEMRALAIDSAGIIDPVREIVLDAPNLRLWEEFPLAQRLAEAFELPAHLENDVNAMAYGEWRLGAGRGTRHLVCLTLGTGVGGGLVLNGALYRGAHGAGGELGHITLVKDGPACPCRSTGCLERYVGAAAIVDRAGAALARDRRPSPLRAVDTLTPRDIGEAANAGDAVAIEVLEETGRWLGVGLASIANAFDPERIVIGGGVAKSGDWILEPARRVLRERAMSVPARSVEVLPAALGNQAAVVGATLLALERHPG